MYCLLNMPNSSVTNLGYILLVLLLVVLFSVSFFQIFNAGARKCLAFQNGIFLLDKCDLTNKVNPIKSIIHIDIPFCCIIVHHKSTVYFCFLMSRRVNSLATLG